jgi:hypothetical protein
LCTLFADHAHVAACNCGCHVWSRHFTPRGTPYYHNRVRAVSLWLIPTDYEAPAVTKAPPPGRSIFPVGAAKAKAPPPELSEWVGGTPTAVLASLPSPYQVRPPGGGNDPPLAASARVPWGAQMQPPTWAAAPPGHALGTSSSTAKAPPPARMLHRKAPPPVRGGDTHGGGQDQLPVFLKAHPPGWVAAVIDVAKAPAPAAVKAPPPTEDAAPQWTV